MSNNTGGPAFPHHIEHPNGHWPGVTHAGMTLRDYFAAKAMQAMIAHPDCATDKPAEVFARAAYVAADAMLKQREASK